MSIRRLRPNSEAEAKEFVQLCLRQGVSREKIAEFLRRLKIDPRYALEGSEREKAELTETDVSLELEVDEVVLRESLQADTGPSRAIPQRPEMPSRPFQPLRQPEQRIILENRPNQKRKRGAEEQFHREVALAAANMRMLRDDRKRGVGWFRFAFALTAAALIALFASSWTEEPKATPIAYRLEAKTPLIPAALLKRAPASVTATAVPAVRR